MFAYCLNAPVNCQDSSGLAGTAALGNTRDGFVRESGGAGVSGDWLAALLLYVSLTAQTASKKKTETIKSEVIPITDASTCEGNNNNIYYGADLYGGSLRLTTPAMSFDEAYTWATSTAIIGVYPDRAGWGLYTYEYDDALEMAIALSPTGPVVLDPAKGGHRAHFHTAYRYVDTVSAQSFHIWYG